MPKYKQAKKKTLAERVQRTSSKASKKLRKELRDGDDLFSSGKRARTTLQYANESSIPSMMSGAEKKEIAFEMRLERKPLYDIARRLGVSQPRVSQMLREVMVARRQHIEELGEDLLIQELESLDHMICHWYPIARGLGPFAADAALVCFKYIQQKHKLLGLEVNKHEVNGNFLNRNVNVAPEVDLSKLSVDELVLWEQLMLKARVDPPTMTKSQYQQLETTNVLEPLPADD